MIHGKQARLQRSLIIEGVPLSTVCYDHTPPAITARTKEYTGQAIVTEKMVGVEKLEAKFKLNGSVALTRNLLGKGYNQLIDIIVTDIGNIGNNGLPYAHTYIYSANVKSIVPDTPEDGGEGCEVTLSLTTYEFKFDGKTIDEIDGITGLVMLGGNIIVPAVV